MKVWKDHSQDQLTDLQHGRHHPLVLNRPNVKAPPQKDENVKTLKQVTRLLVRVEFTQDLMGEICAVSLRRYTTSVVLTTN